MIIPPYYKRDKRIRTFLRNYVIPSERKEQRTMATETKQKPAKTYRRGALSVSIWKREKQTADGVEVYYNTTAQRAYTKDDGATWEYSDSFGTDDLPTVAALLNLAFMWIVSSSDK